MATTLALIRTEAPYEFKSMGIRDINTLKFRESKLFPIGQVVELTSGNFPLNDFSDIYNKTHVIGDKTVNIVGYTSDCGTEQLCSLCIIQVVSSIIEEREVEVIVEPVAAEPESEPLDGEVVGSEPVESEHVESEPLESEHVESEPLESEPLESEPVESEPVP